MEVKFIKCAKSKLSSVPVVDGQVIVLTDAADVYYDMSGGRRRCVSNGNSSNPGLVKLSDAYKSSRGAASSSVGASSKAVYDCYTALNNKITSVKKSTQFFSGSATKTSTSTNTYFEFSDLGFSTSLLPTGTQGDVFMCDALFVINSTRTGYHAGKIYKGNLVWTYDAAKGDWTIYQYTIGQLYYDNQVWINTNPSWTGGSIGSKFASSYLGRLVLNITPTTTPDPEPGYTLIMTLHNAVHFSGIDGTLYDL